MDCFLPTLHRLLSAGTAWTAFSQHCFGQLPYIGDLFIINFQKFSCHFLRSLVADLAHDPADPGAGHQVHCLLLGNAAGAKIKQHLLIQLSNGSTVAALHILLCAEDQGHRLVDDGFAKEQHVLRLLRLRSRS